MKEKTKYLSRSMFHPLFFVMLLITLLLAFSIGTSVTGCSSGGDSGTNDEVDEAPRIGAMAPRFTLVDLGGESRSLEDYLGRAVLINFWTTWCPYCVIEMPLMQDLHESGQDVVVLAINVKEKKEDVQAFISAEGYTFPVLLDERAQVNSRYQVRGFPTTFAVDGTGTITAIRVGAFDAAGLAALVESAVD